jgi:hypothetical protein
MLISYQRRFSIWSYHTSHGELLLRSNKSEKHSTRVEILFKGVEAMELRSVFNSISIEESNKLVIQDRKSRPLEILNDDDKVYIIKDKDWEGFVIAAAVFWQEDDKEYYDQSTLSIFECRMKDI